MQKLQFIDMVGVPIDDLCPPRSIETAVSDWCGFVAFRPAERAAPALAIHELVDRLDAEWTYGRYWKAPLEFVAPIGCYFLRDIELSQPGILHRHGRLVDDGSVSTQVAFARLQAAQGTSFGAPVRTIACEATGLIIAGPGFEIWGHWVAEFLPRVALAYRQLGALGRHCLIPLPHGTPPWVETLLGLTCGVDAQSILYYDPHVERVAFSHAIIPSFGFSGDYNFHSVLREFYQGLRPSSVGARRRLCLSRGGGRYGGNRAFVQRDLFEREAAKRGFEIFRPEDASITEQIAALTESSIVVGEYGSAMHSAVFAGAGTVIGCIGMWNALQLRLGELFGHRSVYMTRGCHWPVGERPIFIDAHEDDIVGFLDLTVSLEATDTR